MADAFISYAREDQDFARRLHAALEAAGHSLWVDWESIHPSSDWFTEIAEGIDQSDAVIYIVTGTSVRSSECRAELDHAQRARIRIIPVLRERVEPEQLPAGVGAFQWVEFLDDAAFDDSVRTLRRALETDLDWVKVHTRLRLRALEWEREDRRAGKLLNRSELREAEDWNRRSSEDEGRRPSPLVYDYLAASGRSSRRRQGWFTAAVSVALVIAAGLAAWALVERGTAQEQERLAVSRELSASSLLTLEDDPELSVLLAREAAGTARTQQAEDALRRALAESNARLVMRGHRKDLALARYSPDGSRVLTASDDTTARLWDARSGREIAVLRGHRLPLGGGEFSPDGSRALTYAQDYTTRVYDGADGRRVAVLRDPNDNRIQSAKFSPDSRQVATATFINTAFVWDSERGEILHALPRNQPRLSGSGADHAEFSPDGELVVTAHQEGMIRLWRASTGALLLTRRAEEGVGRAHFSPDGIHVVTATFQEGVRTWTLPDLAPEFVLAPGGDEFYTPRVSFSRDGSMTAVTEANGLVRIWDSTGRQLATLSGHEGLVHEARFHPNGRYVVTAGDDGTALVWEIATERVVTRLSGHRAAVVTAEFAPRGDTVLTASLDDTARVWDAGTAETAPLLRPPGARACRTAVFSADGKRIAATGCGGSAYVFDAAGEAARQMQGSAGTAGDLELSPGGRYLASSDFGADLRVHDVRTGRVVLTGKEFESVEAFSRDGSMVLLHSSDGARVWDLRRGRQVVKLKEGTAGGGAEFGPGDKLLYTGGLINHRIYVSELPSGKIVRRFRAPPFRGESAFSSGVDGNEDIELSHDGRRLLAVHVTGSARIIDTSTGHTDVRIPGSELPDERMFSGAAAIFSPDEQHVVTKAGWDNLVRIWDAATGRLEMQLEGHSGGVSTVEYDREGRLLATTALDDTARIWSATSGDTLVVLPGAGNADLSPDGRRVLIGENRARIHSCDVCGDLDDLLALAKRRVSRDFTAAERERYLHE